MADRRRPRELDDPELRARRCRSQRCEAAGIDVSGYRLPHLVTRIAIDGVICDRPRPREGAHLRAARRVGKGAEEAEREKALGELARRSLAGHGPAEPRDLGGLVGLGVSDARAAWELVADDLEELWTARGPQWVLRGASRARGRSQANEPAVRLLAGPRRLAVGSGMAEAAPLTVPEVEDLVRRVYLHLFDTHAPVDEFLTCLADEELEMRFPEATVRGHVEFRRWYDGIVRTYFDEVHTIKELDVSVDGDRAAVKVLVNWQARTWTPPAARSEGLVYDAGQRWEVRRSPVTGAPVIVRYVVDTFTPAAPPG